MAVDVSPTCDVVILGGGVAGLWSLDRLCAAGYDALLLEKTDLGDGQSVAAQGIIHSGMKYHVSRDLTLDALADMPTRWRQALSGTAGSDLRSATVLSSDMYLWAPTRLGADLLVSAVRRTSRSATREVPVADWPASFQGPGRGGALSIIAEPVLDVPSVLDALRARHRARVRRLPPAGPTYRDGVLACGPIRLRPRCVVIAAGAGNEILPAVLDQKPVPTQRRPLCQIVIAGMREAVYAHCLGTSTKPLATVTSHPDGDGGWYWYVGGGIAEGDAAADPDVTLRTARQKVPAWFPGADFSRAAWAAFAIDRAEHGGDPGVRPGDVAIVQQGSVLTAWPTKLALAPRLAEALVERVAALVGAPSKQVEPPADFLALSEPGIAEPPWRRIQKWS